MSTVFVYEHFPVFFMWSYFRKYTTFNIFTRLSFQEYPFLNSNTYMRNYWWWLYFCESLAFESVSTLKVWLPDSEQTHKHMLEKVIHISCSPKCRQHKTYFYLSHQGDQYFFQDCLFKSTHKYDIFRERKKICVCIGCFTSRATIFQLYMWQHIDVEADWRRSWTYGRAPNAIDTFVGSLTCLSKHRHGANLLTVIPRNRSISVAFYDMHGEMEDLFSSYIPRVPTEKKNHMMCCNLLLRFWNRFVLQAPLPYLHKMAKPILCSIGACLPRSQRCQRVSNVIFLGFFRFVQQAPLPYLQCKMAKPILCCAIAACSLDHKDANASVMKYLSDFLTCATKKEVSEV